MIDNNVMQKTMIAALNRCYPTAMQRLRLEWQDRRNTGAVGGREEYEYILTRLPEVLAAEAKTFQDKNLQCRASAMAEQFRIKNNPALWKKHYATGFPLLDDALGGGLTTGVHYIGAISSLGKSTFILQMVDHMADNGIPVILLSLEMRAVDLFAKLVSMHTYLLDARLAQTANMLTDENAHYTDEEWSVVEAAVDIVAKHGASITILESQIQPYTADRIAKYVDEYVQAYQTKPVLVVDYLQLLAPSDRLKGYSDKQAVDYNVSKFRAIAATYDIPIVVISSLNRASYDSKMSLSAFKESGSVEYSADTLIGLQLHGVGEADFDAAEAKAAYPRAVDLVILKQRYGPSSHVISYDFYTKYNYFGEQQWERLPDSTKTPFDEGTQLAIKGAAPKKRTRRI